MMYYIYSFEFLSKEKQTEKKEIVLLVIWVLSIQNFNKCILNYIVLSLIQILY